MMATPGGRDWEMVGKTARQTWQTHICNEGDLGTSGGGPCLWSLQLLPPEEILSHPE